jgi:hypothetical protein
MDALRTKRDLTYHSQRAWHSSASIQLAVIQKYRQEPRELQALRKACLVAEFKPL